MLPDYANRLDGALVKLYLPTIGEVLQMLINDQLTKTPTRTLGAEVSID